MAARHARTRPTARTAAPASCPGASRRREELRSRRCAPQDAAAPTLVGIITSREDFEELRRDGGTEYSSFAVYLEEMEQLIGRIREAGGTLKGRAFHPGDLVDFCRQHGLSLADPGSHTAYTADPAADVEWVRYEDEPLDEFLGRLVLARRRGLVHRRLERLLAETAEAAATGVFPEEPLREAYERGAAALRRMLLGAGPGRFRLVCALRPPAEPPVEAWADLLLERTGAEDGGAVLRIEDADLDLFCSLLCTGYALGLTGGALLSGMCEERGSVAWGWGFDGGAEGGGFTPRNAADVLLDLSLPAASWIAVCLPGAAAAPGFPLDEIALD
ncbi:hypothetical protein ACEZCY_00260 [Streptacidiphilus sp. N1-12]|uniref:Uncharacterized protein n=2 Tax=Streptacidiphilus alkalitolerans TaxID=3342712 RepID=A0ABV6V1W3_9ACTN